MSGSIPTQPQYVLIINLSSNVNSTTSMSPVSSQLVPQQQPHEMQSTRQSQDSRVGNGSHAMNQQARLGRSAQDDNEPGEDHTDLLFGGPLELILPAHFHHDASACKPGANTFIFRNRTTQQLTEVPVDQATSEATRNAPDQSGQSNAATGPDMRVSHNHATNGSTQNNAPSHSTQSNGPNHYTQGNGSTCTIL